MALVLSSALAATAASSPREDAADLILRHGRFYPVSSPDPIDGSLAVRDGRIVALGDDAAAMAFAGADTELIELGGRAVTPGLIDAHSHLAGLGRSLTVVDLRGAPSEEEMVRRVAERARTLPAGAWVLGRGWDQNLWPGGAFPTHQKLSAAVPDRPVLLERIDGHASLVNRRAMELTGIDAAVADPPGGRLLRDESGAPTGVLVDTAEGLVSGKLPAPSAAEVREHLRAGAAHCATLGLTTVTDMGIGAETLDAYRAARRDEPLAVRAIAFLDGTDEALVARWVAERGADDTELRFVIRGVKLYADGALGSRGAALVEPYADDPPNVGLLRVGVDEMERAARAALDGDYQLAVHAIGDRGGLVVLDGFERALAGRPAGGPPRLRLEHAQVLRLQDIERMARLGVVAGMQPTHATSDMPWAGERVGARRLAGAYAWRKVLDAGGRLAFGSDFPVELPDPRLGLYAAVTRQDLAGNPAGGWLPGERLTRAEALRGFTLDAALSLGVGDQLGSLEVGKLADLVVFGRDPFTVTERELATVPVDLTIVGGTVVHRREDGR